MVDLGTATTTSAAVARRIAVEHRRLPDGYVGEAFLVWCRGACGTVGDLAAFPDRCSDCGAPREELYYWTGD